MADENIYSQSFEYLKGKLEGGKDSFGKLMKEIVDSGVCTKCSACVGTCDVLIWDEATDRPKLVGKCTGCGICYNQCPRTLTTVEYLVGDFKAAYTAKALDESIHGQDGGVVTALLAYGLTEGLLDCAIVTKKSKEDPWKPEPTIVTKAEGLYDSAGSIYAHSQTLIPLLKAIREGYHSIGFVGTPCNIEAVAKMQESPTGMIHLFMRTNILKIGLFCMDSFSHEGLGSFLKDNGSSWEEVEKCRIEKGKFVFQLKKELGKEDISRRVHSLNRYKSSSCNFCTDLTSERADISVGSVGSASGLSTVLVRSGIGHEILLDAVDKGWIRIEPLVRSKMKFVLNLARMKKQSFYNIRERRTFVYKREEKEGEKLRREIRPASKEEIIKAAARKLVKLASSAAAPEEKIVSFILVNSSGETLENVVAQMSNNKEFFEIQSWEHVVSLWFPFEELRFELPYSDPESDFMIQLFDQKGLMMSRTIKLQKLLAPKT